MDAQHETKLFLLKLALLLQILYVNMFRSENMNYFEIIIPRQLSWESMNLFGRIGNVHFVDNNPNQRPFYRQLKRCDQCIDKLIRLEDILQLNNINTHRIHRSSIELTKLIEQWTDVTNPQNSIYQFDKIEQMVEELWERYHEISKSVESFQAKLSYFQDRLILLKALKDNLGGRFYSGEPQLGEELPIGQDFSRDRFECRCGIINKEDQIRLERIVFRISHGLVYTRLTEIVQQNPSIKKKRSIFMILYPRNMQYLGTKLKTLSETFSSFNFDIPLTQKDYDYMLLDTTQQIEEYTSFLLINTLERKSFMNQLVTSYTESCSLSKVEYLKAFSIKEKIIYQQLNRLNEFSNFVQGYAYIAASQSQQTIHEISSLAKPNQPSVQMISRDSRRPPTLFKTNSFTATAQEIVQTYGVARYQQGNPGLFTCITFPFLFGVMFGDIGHGLILLLFGIILCIKQAQYKELSYLKLMIPHRYMILLMGFFSFYCGLIYNEYLSINLNLFGSCYQPMQVKEGEPIPRMDDCVYAFGLDPVWGIASNALAFINSLKMKLSVIIGVLHMTLGLLVKALNAIFFRSSIDFFVEFIPELIFLWVLFGYMDILIIVKWLTDWGLYSPVAPSVITTLIDLPLRFGKMQLQMFEGQAALQPWLVIIAIICIPWILIPKPVLVSYAIKRQTKQRDEQLSRLITQRNNSSRNDSQSLRVYEDQQPKITLDQLVVHQLIETIEYILGCISNTASYLRLWALSLAHSQLSEVFFLKSVQNPIIMGYTGIPLVHSSIKQMVINFVILAMVTFAVLICMDSMECFLHALRLHWVEFQNKFYKADGYLFVPFSLYEAIRQSLA